MPIDPGSFRTGQQNQEDRIDKRRSDKAKAFREYVKAKTDAGEEVDPYELDRVRHAMVGGDPYLATFIPAGAALHEMTTRANQQANLSRLTLNAESATQRKTERDYMQSIVADNWDKAPEDLAKILGDNFGTDGARLYDTYRSELPSMLNEASAKKQAEMMSDPRMRFVFDDETANQMFQVEMRNPRQAALIKNAARQNARLRKVEDATAVANMKTLIPAGELANPAAQDWWSDFAGMLPEEQQAMAGSMVDMRSGMDTVAADAKLVELAATDPLLATAAANGDEEAIFQAVSTLMVRAGYNKPTSIEDPSYQRAKTSLDMVSRTNTTALYKKRESDLKSAYTEQAQAIIDGASDRAKALGAMIFFDRSKYGTEAKGVFTLDDRISTAATALRTDPAFFPSEENLQFGFGMLKQIYDRDPENFDPGAAVQEILDKGAFDTRASWVDDHASMAVEAEYGIPPNTHFPTWSADRQSSIENAMKRTLDAVAKAPVENKAQALRIANQALTELKTEAANISAAINSVTTDPAKRNSITGFDQHQAIESMKNLQQRMMVLDNYIRQEGKNLMRPQSSAPEADPTMPMPNIIHGGDSDTEMRGDASGDMLHNISTNIGNPGQSPLDGYLDEIAMIESGGNPFARAATSSAAGLYQFTRGTWAAMVNRYGAVHGITTEDIYDPAAQRTMAAYLTRDNAYQLLAQTGRKPLEGDLYLAHFLGAGNASTMINNLGTNKLAAQMFPDAAKANPTIFYDKGIPLTVDQVYRRLTSKLKKRMRDKSTTQKA